VPDLPFFGIFNSGNGVLGLMVIPVGWNGKTSTLSGVNLAIFFGPRRIRAERDGGIGHRRHHACLFAESVLVSAEKLKAFTHEKEL